MLKDEGDDSNAKKSDEVVAIDCVTCLRKGQLWNATLGDGTVHHHHAQKGCLQWKMGSNFNPGAEAENQRKHPENSPSNNPLPLQHCQGAIDCLRSPPLGFEPHPIGN